MQNLRDPENPPFVLSFHENTTATGRQKVWQFKKIPPFLLDPKGPHLL